MTTVTEPATSSLDLQAVPEEEVADLQQALASLGEFQVPAPVRVQGPFTELMLGALKPRKCDREDPSI